MELREAIGRRRSIRFVRPYKMVEPEKIQRMFEASRRASHWGNVQSLRAVAVFRDSATTEELESLQAFVVGWQVKIAPVVIIWYCDPTAVDGQSDRLHELTDAGALGFGDKAARKKALDEVLIPIFDGILEAAKEPGGLNYVDCGQGIAQATLMAYEQGLGTCCLGSPFGEKMFKALGIPDYCQFLLMQTVGYPAEDWEAGGQRPRLPFGELYKMNHYDKPFPRSDEVVAELTEDGLITREGPLDDREQELDFLQRALDIEPPGLL